MNTPSSFQSKIKDLHGAEGQRWLGGLPSLLDKYSQEWELRFELPSLELSYNFILPARRKNNQSVIFKAGFPSEVLNQEIQALRYFNGQGTVKLLEFNVNDGVLLLERIEPGTSMRDFFNPGTDDDAIVIAARVISLLQDQKHPVPDSFDFPTLNERLNALNKAYVAAEKGKAPFDLHLIQTAIAGCQHLIDTTKTRVLLHGDLHQGNILRSSGETWVAIDPHGVIGDPCFEVAAFVRNPTALASSPNVANILKRRIDLFSQHLSMDKNRIWGWSFVQTLVASWWVYEDHGDGWQAWHEMSQKLLKIKP